MADETEETPAKLTSAQVIERLRARYAPPEWIVLQEVRNATGYRRTPRSADLMALSTFPSRGLQLFGFEVKVSRGDFVKELKAPEKAVDLQSRCDRWYLVLGAKGIASPDEVPPTWGIIAPSGSGLRIIREAPDLKPEPWPRDFVASLVRNAAGSSAEPEQIAKAREEGRADGEKSAGWDRKRLQDDYASLQAVVDAFEAASGERLNQWTGEAYAKRIGARVRAAKKADLVDHVRHASRLREQLEQAAHLIREAEQEAAAVVGEVSDGR